MNKRNYKHGYSRHPLYGRWNGIMDRCHNQNSGDYQYYGARGIFVCDEWRYNPIAFVKWGLNNGWDKGLQLDRKENNDGYSPDNCWFVTRLKNSNNRRDNTIVSIEGEKLSLAEAHRKYGKNGISYQMVVRRYQKGWTIIDALTIEKYRKVC